MHHEMLLYLLIAIKTNNHPSMLMSALRKLGELSYKLWYCKDTDQTYQMPIPVLVEPLLGILSVVSGESLPA